MKRYYHYGYWCWEIDDFHNFATKVYTLVNIDVNLMPINNWVMAGYGRYGNSIKKVVCCLNAFTTVDFRFLYLKSNFGVDDYKLRKFKKYNIKCYLGFSNIL